MTELIRSSGLTGYKPLVTRLGGNANALLLGAGIAPGALDDADEPISLRAMIRLLEATASVLHCPDFGLQLALEQDLRILGPVGIIGTNSPTVGTAIEAMIEHLDFYSPLVLCAIDRQTSAPNVLLTWDLAIGGEPRRRQMAELAMGLYHRHMVALAGSRFSPVAVLMRHTSPLPQRVYRRYFGTGARLGQALNALVVQPADLKQPLDNSDLHLRQIIADYVRRGHAKHPLDTRRQVEYLARRLLPSGRCTLKTIARQLCLHERTLQRRLNEDGLAFAELLESVRRERAEELLADSRLSIAEVARQVGFAEQSSFTRACHRWFGRAPRNFKRYAVGEAPPLS